MEGVSATSAVCFENYNPIWDYRNYSLDKTHCQSLLEERKTKWMIRLASYTPQEQGLLRKDTHFLWDPFRGGGKIISGKLLLLKPQTTGTTW